MTLTLLIVSIYFLIGGIATIIINRRKPGPGAKQGWIKYFAYFVIVYLVIAIINYGLLLYLSIAISIIGLYEIIKVWREGQKSLGVLLVAAAVFLFLAGAFVFVSATVSVKQALDVYLATLVFDGFSQISGQLFGKRKLAPVISPGKTIEGVIGGFIITLLTVLWITGAIPIGLLPMVTIITLVLCGFALAGDLLASWYKRICGVKDYSNLIPGHGGVLDRFDSFIGAMIAYGIIDLYSRAF